MQTLQPNATLQGGKYIIKKVLGQGGFGITYLADQTMLERQVAIKEFFMKGLCDRDDTTSHVTIGTVASRDTVTRFREKFLKEARNIAKLNHPNIVRIFDVFEENGTAYYVMDYVDGESLSVKVKREGALPEKMATHYILQIAEALEYIHHRSMNHLDVKPANIVLNADGDTAFLIDFGLSKQYDAAGEQTSTTPVGISDGYAPLEQYRPGGVGTFSPQTDIYSLGATFFYLLTGIVPPSASDINEDGVPVERLQTKGVSQRTIDAICKSMESSRKKRFAEVGQLKQMLNAANDDNISVDIIDKATVIDEETHLLGTTDSRAQQPLSQPHQSIPQNKTITVYGVTFEMVKVEAGTFMMGATPEMEDPWQDEKPVHQVTLTKDYYIGQTQVTQALWKTVMGDNPSVFKGDNLPVENVSWEDCQTFIKKLNLTTGLNFRLPTEAEWEYAARGGKYSRGYQYSGSNILDVVAWYSDNSKGSTHEVATKQSNELGIYDMSGNVYEWCADKFGSYGNYALTNPRNESFWDLSYVYRGGCWTNFTRYCRSSNRTGGAPGGRSSNLGLRLALSE